MFHNVKDKHQVHYHGDGLKNLFIGIGLGAALAWLFTTKEGELLRKKLLEEEGNVEEKIRDFLSSFKKEVVEPARVETKIDSDSLRDRPEPEPAAAPVEVVDEIREEPQPVRPAPSSQPWVVQEMEAQPSNEIGWNQAHSEQEDQTNDSAEQTNIEVIETSGPDEAVDSGYQSGRTRRFFRRVR